MSTPIALPLLPTYCLAGAHALVCACGERLRRIPSPSSPAEEWTYVSVRTGDQIVRTSDLGDRTWDEVAAGDPETYSALRARYLLGHFYAVHVHAPVECRPGHRFVVPECHGRPMHFSPSGWLCRVAGAPHDRTEVAA